MRRTMMAAMLAVTAGCAPAAQQGQTDEDYAAINTARNAFVAAVNAGDMAKAVEIYADDAVVMPSNTAAIHGKLAIREFLAGFPPVGDFKIFGEETKGGAGLVTVRGQYAMNLMPPGASAAVADTGKFVEVWLKQPDGSWRMIWDIYNTDIPRPAL